MNVSQFLIHKIVRLNLFWLITILPLCDLSIGEIYYGTKKGEERKTKEQLNLFRRYHFSKEVSRHFIETMSDQYGRKIKIPDAIIAAFAKANNLKMYTLNVKDFRMIKGIKRYKPN